MVLYCFRFSAQFMSWISMIFYSARISILINRVPCGYFGCSRGVREDDPLSFLLFVLAEDFLSRYLTFLSDKGKLRPISSPRSIKAPTHFLFVDDVFLFSEASFSNLKTILAIFESYSLLSGQEVNWDKSFTYLGAGVRPLMHYRLLNYTRMRHGCDYLIYLGVLIFKGVSKVRHLRPIIDKILRRINSWKGMCLS